MSESGMAGSAPGRPALRAGLLTIGLSLALAGCGPPLLYGPSRAAALPGPGTSNAAAPAAGTPTVPPESPAGRPAGPARPAPRVARARTVGPAAQALIEQARAQSATGEFALAAATLERALRIEPDHPQLWLELGRVRQAQHNFAQAEVMGRKALSAADDHATQALAWRLIADNLEAEGRTRQAQEAAENARRLTAP